MIMDFPEKIFVYDTEEDVIYSLTPTKKDMGFNYRQYSSNNNLLLNMYRGSKEVWNGIIPFVWHETIGDCLKYRKKFLEEDIAFCVKEITRLREMISSTVEVRC